MKRESNVIKVNRFIFLSEDIVNFKKLFLYIGVCFLTLFVSSIFSYGQEWPDREKRLISSYETNPTIVVDCSKLTTDDDLIVALQKLKGEKNEGDKSFLCVNVYYAVKKYGNSDISSVISIVKTNYHKSNKLTPLKQLENTLKDAYLAAQYIFSDNMNTKITSMKQLTDTGTPFKNKECKFIRANLEFSSGYIIFKHLKLDNSNSTTAKGLKAGEGMVNHNGEIFLPILK